MKQLKITAQRRSQNGSSVLRAMLWVALGAALMYLVAADPFDLHSLDQMISGAHEQKNEAQHQLWTCGMHPEVLSQEPGTCPICEMDLTAVESSPEAQPRESQPEMWTCPMHPEILSEEAGACPICLMDLVPVKDGGDAATHSADDHQKSESAPVVTIDAAVVQNMNVTSIRVVRRDLSRRIRTVGHLDYDQEGMVTVSTRYSGFVEKVHANYLGQNIAQGDPLFEIYAPELVQTQQELLAALDYERSLGGATDEVRRRAHKLVAAARTRLGYWEISADEVARVEANGQVKRTLTVTAPADGVVMKRIHGLQGMAIRPGMDVIHIADLSTLWLTVEVFEDQLPWLGVGATAEVGFDYLPGERFSGRVRLIEPEVSPQTRSVRLTLEVPNRDRKLRVGMYATVHFEPVAARDALVVPTQSVIRTGVRDLVVVALGDGRFAPREVELGLESDDVVQILNGLDDDDEVVTSSQFLIDSESNLQAAVQRMLAGSASHRH